MTDKKENILNAALELFAKDGYNTVSTSKIAKQAGVSEGLIFRHFDNKKGLLDALLADAEQKLSQVFAPIIFESDPKKVIRKTIELPFTIDKADYDYWKLQFKLKWEAAYNKPEKMKPFIDKLTWAFTKLEYEEPANEAILLQQTLDAISISILRDGSDQLSLKSLLFAKYKV